MTASLVEVLQALDNVSDLQDVTVQQLLDYITQFNQCKNKNYISKLPSCKNMFQYHMNKYKNEGNKGKKAIMKYNLILGYIVMHQVVLRHSDRTCGQLDQSCIQTTSILWGDSTMQC
jgi:hypothetical protein